MSWTSIFAIYTLVWSISAFFVLPFHGRRAADEAVPLVAGQDHGAPSHVNMGRIAIQVTILATVFFGLFYLAYDMGWANPNVIAGRE